ncbi:unnamed protein product [Vitrella brassicaformis CCMP3155]|uniref:Uncharacterized protein n=1 Tax=Vitrella brassicaformis (strain CCMP3155) TaxID=1169540 RepID=A0A0G4FKN4_VITBC|nr:unnamed protein product [Vitrella brassicaformis CCMP3155]|eukprot:CEM14549.1 unnamed protein product [Vitrella brassicaformis CCMP3155]
MKRKAAVGAKAKGDGPAVAPRPNLGQITFTTGGHNASAASASSSGGGEGGGSGLLAEAKSGVIKRWVEEEFSKAVLQMQCTYRCSSAGAYDGAAFLKSIPQPDFAKKADDDNTGYLLLLRQGDDTKYFREHGAPPFLFKLDKEGGAGSVKKVTKNLFLIDLGGLFDNSTLSFTVWLADEEEEGPPPHLQEEDPLLEETPSLTHEIGIYLPAPFDAQQGIYTHVDSEVVGLRGERPLLSGAVAPLRPGRVTGHGLKVAGGCDAIEVWEVVFEGDKKGKAKGKAKGKKRAKKG